MTLIKRILLGLFVLIGLLLVCAFAGHTHGGQVRIPFTPSWTWMSYTREDQVHADGWIKGYGAPGNTLYVNRGIGFSVFPLRLNCPFELTLFTLIRS